MQATGGTALNSDPNATNQAEAPEETTEPDETEPPGRRRALVVFALAAPFALLVDVLTKEAAVSALTGREPVRLLGGAVYLDLIRNSGAAFSLGTGYTFVFPVITLVVVGWIGWTVRRLRSVPWGLALGLVLGGALGNLTDRIFRAPGPMVGHVVDFISVFGPGGEKFPVFNAADSALCLGVALAVLLELTGRRLDGTRAGRSADRSAVPDSARG